MWNAGPRGSALGDGKMVRGVWRSRVKQLEQNEETIVMRCTGAMASVLADNGYEGIIEVIEAGRGRREAERTGVGASIFLAAPHLQNRVIT